VDFGLLTNHKLTNWIKEEDALLNEITFNHPVKNPAATGLVRVLTSFLIDLPMTK
jgi:hypothetical protein